MGATAQRHCSKWWERPWAKALGIPSTWQLGLTCTLDLARANAVGGIWEEKRWHANLLYVCHKTKVSGPWRVRGGVDRRATSCSALHRGGTTTMMKRSRNAFMDLWMEEQGRSRESQQLLGRPCHRGSPAVGHESVYGYSISQYQDLSETGDSGWRRQKTVKHPPTQLD